MIKTIDERRKTREKVTEPAEVIGVSLCHLGAKGDRIHSCHPERV